jgi:hypothetical protein
MNGTDSTDPHSAVKQNYRPSSPENLMGCALVWLDEELAKSQPASVNGQTKIGPLLLTISKKGIP